MTGEGVTINGLKASLVGAVMLLAALGTGSADAQSLTGLRLGQASPRDTRIVFDFDGPPRYEITGLARGEGVLSVEFDASASIRPGTENVRLRGHIATIERRGSVFLFALGTSARLEKAFVIQPSRQNPNHRLVIDLTEAPKSEFLASLPVREKTPSTRAASADPLSDIIAASVGTPAPGSDEKAAPAIPPEPERRVIVIDPGHGGSDPGSIGVSGTHEADVTLAAARVLKDVLEKSGRYDVVLTRSGDYRLALEERVPIARDAKADLFLSIHADSIANQSVRGATVYTLSDEGSERSARVASETGDFTVFDLDVSKEEPEVGGILFDLAQRRTGTESDRFADLLIDRLAGVTKLVKNSHRKANMRVLLAPDVPAVILELAYMSNPKDEANLTSQKWRLRTMTAVASSIDAYFDNDALHRRHAANNADAAR